MSEKDKEVEKQLIEVEEECLASKQKQSDMTMLVREQDIMIKTL